MRPKRKIVEVAAPAPKLVPHFQPIVSVADGRVVGFEALARLEGANMKASAPGEILSAMDPDARFSLFFSNLAEGVSLCKRLGPDYADVYVSINADASLVLRPDFQDALNFGLAEMPDPNRRLVVEILEDEAILDPLDMAAAVRLLKRLGVCVALDDIGSAYASLSNMRDLPVDVLKLDRSFALGLRERPQDLHFVWNLVGLARGLGKRLVVEGVETLDVLEALSILGVEYVQGFAIARPMAAPLVPAWLQTFGSMTIERKPNSYLGVYASHLMVVEACHILERQPLPMQWLDSAADPHACDIGRYFDAHALHEGSCGESHKRFHAVLPDYRVDRSAWNRAAEDFRDHLAEAIRKEAARTKV